MTLPEKLGACLLVAGTLGLGLFPRGILDWIQPVLAGPLFEGLRRALGT